LDAVCQAGVHCQLQGEAGEPVLPATTAEHSEAARQSGFTFCAWNAATGWRAIWAFCAAS